MVVCQCGTSFETYHQTQRWCSATCRQRNADAAKRSRGIRRSGRPYERLKAQVCAEEPTCWLCGGPFIGEWPHPKSFTVDHLVPLSAGGVLMDRHNCRAAHLRCNSSRGASLPPEVPEFFFAGVGWVAVEV